MRLHKPTRSLPESLRQGELEFRRQLSAAAAYYRQPTAIDDYPHSPASGLQAQLLPLDEQGKTGTACQIEVKDIDERGITFQHPQPLHDRRALLVLEGLNLGRIAAEVDLSWCRFSQGGHYISGGRFVGLVGLSA